MEAAPGREDPALPAPSPRRRRALIGGIVLACTAALTAATAVVAAVTSPTTPSVTIAQEDEASSVPILRFAGAWSELADTERTFTVLVAGDSTGDQPGEWVDIAFRSLALENDRPLVIHQWDKETAAYGSEIRANEDATGAELVVWNGSAAGKTAAYSLEHLDVLAPEHPDVVFINHGLNNSRHPDAVGGELTDLVAAIESRWGGTVGYAAILENPRFDEWHDGHAAVIDQVRTWATAHPDILLIDAYSAYLDTGDPLDYLLPDELHPTPDGSELTASTVLDAIAGALS